MSNKSHFKDIIDRSSSNDRTKSIAKEMLDNDKVRVRFIFDEGRVSTAYVSVREASGSFRERFVMEVRAHHPLVFAETGPRRRTAISLVKVAAMLGRAR